MFAIFVAVVYQDLLILEVIIEFYNSLCSFCSKLDDFLDNVAN